MTRDDDRLLEMLDVATAPRASGNPAALDAETRSLRDAWSALGDLLAQADAQSDSRDEGRLRPEIRVKAAKRNRKNLAAAAACAAALSLALAVTILIGSLGGVSPDEHSAAPLATTENPPSATAPWVDQLDEQIAAAGEFVIWLESDPASDRARFSDDRALNSLIWHLNAMNLEASSGSL